MIFTTRAEGERVGGIIDARGEFEDLTPEEMFTIRCMYDCLDQIDDVYGDYDEGSVTANALEECYALCVATISEVYVSFIDNH